MKFQKVDDFLDFMVKTGKSPAAAIRIAVDNEIVHEYAVGTADLQTKTPFTGKEKLYLYSNSKLTAVTAAMQLLEKGMYSMNEPLYHYIPEYRHMKIRDANGNLTEAKNPITVSDLFTMTTGISYDTNTEGFAKARELTGGKMDTLTVVRCMAEDPLLFEPGTDWRYGHSHDILAGLVELLSGKKYRDYVRENIFEPLGMENSTFHAGEKTLSEMASLYRFVSGDDPQAGEIKAAKEYAPADHGTFVDLHKHNEFIYGEEYDSGGAGIISTPDDYIRFLSALANFGVGMNGARILAPGTVDLIRRPKLTIKSHPGYNWPQTRGFGYGFGVRTLLDNGEAGYNGTIGEFGWGGAAGSNCFVDPDRHIAIQFCQHCQNVLAAYYQPRLHNAVYACI